MMLCSSTNHTRTFVSMNFACNILTASNEQRKSTGYQLYLTREDPSLVVLKPEELIENVTNFDAIHVADLNDDLWHNIQSPHAWCTRTMHGCWFY